MRAFLAVNPGDSLRAHIAAFEQRLKTATASSSSRTTWTKPEAVHLTIRFFADLDEALAEPLRNAVASVVQGTTMLNMPLSRLGAFPRTMAPRVLWIGPPPEWEASPDGRALAGLAEAIERACTSTGLVREEKPWRPHLTIARIREGERAAGRVLVDAGAFDRPALELPLAVDAVSLVTSDAGAAGHVHSTLWSAPFLAVV